MRIIKRPSREQWPDIVRRPRLDISSLHQTVETVLNDVREHGDAAVKKYEEKFDHAHLDSIAVTPEEMEEAEKAVSAELKDALKQAHANILAFHAAQRFEGQKTVTTRGVTCWQKAEPIERVGLYIPGGTAPLFSTVLMLATPARIAGCQEIVLCTPPSREGRVHPAILAAARIAGVDRIFKAGGVQAIAAMAYGTESIPKVFKIFGPGNQYVMAAKQKVSLGDVAIDMPAGPSEVCVIADASSRPDFVAADLLSQAEHGTDSQVMLITTDEDMLQQVAEEVDRQLQQLPRREIAAQALENSQLVLVDTKDEAMGLSNAYAPEHLIIETDDCMELAAQVRNAGSVFLGHYTPESAGDYASGTNHTLPTHGYAVSYSGVNLDSYIRKITFQHITPEGVKSIGRTVEIMAAEERLDAHCQAMKIRRESL